MSKQTPLERVIEACGTAANLAQKLNISAQAVSQWDRVPPSRALQVSRITGIPVEELLTDGKAA